MAEYMLTSLLARDFSSVVRHRGLEYFRARRAKIVRGDEIAVEAIVRGTGVYDVTLRYGEGALYVYCTCPYFETNGSCKHLWAVVLTAEKDGYLRAASRAPRLIMMDDDGELPDDEEYSLTPAPRAGADWRRRLSGILSQGAEFERPHRDWPAGSEILYAVDVQASRNAGGLVITLHMRSPMKSGEWGNSKDLSLRLGDLGSVPDAEDREILAQLAGGRVNYGYMAAPAYDALPNRVQLPGALALILAPRMARRGRLLMHSGLPAEPGPALMWDEGGPWQFVLELRPEGEDGWRLEGALKRGEDRMELREPHLLLGDGLVMAKDSIARFSPGPHFAWVRELRTSGSIQVRTSELDELLRALTEDGRTPPLELPPDWEWTEDQRPLQAAVRFHTERVGVTRHMWAELVFRYGDRSVGSTSASRGFYLSQERVFVPRDGEAEAAARRRLEELGLRLALFGGEERWKLAPKRLPAVVRELVLEGWRVEAEGKAFRAPGATRVDVSSGIDWFELRGEVEYGGEKAALPQLLAALRRGDGMVLLGDGTYGLLPEEWLERFAPLAGLGHSETDHLRFRQNQAGLLDALLVAQGEVHGDELFERARARLRDFTGVRALEQPRGFAGTLRDYQREGLGWMEFLREFGFGGCLADDMGVGKTAQVLAVLEGRRVEGCGPSLVVAPKSLMFNWRQESERFTPELRVLEYTGLSRDAGLFASHDLILTTYGTLVRDVVRLKDQVFDYVVLDEAQAIKNASTASAKAVRLLKARNRLALSGTPVENHLGELWSLFEFLNPGMLGEAKVLRMAGGLSRNPSEEARRLLAQALRPFILRRTKQQVAKELPEKTEQTIYCELETTQRKHYDELKRHYRESLLQRVARQGMGRSKMHVLEALLRLRQAACHPGLIDASRVSEPSAKLEVLMEQLTEVLEEGHKALVFSQFTSMLAIVRLRLEAAGIVYEYLDGSTTDRQARVERFQTDEGCGLFLVSLKAGGLGLNLTAAEYVFLLDPWWNPAVEAQAVDRAHRIGQMRRVFAYRLIAKDTVEEKVLELQKSKRDLVEGILGEDHSVIRDLCREDLELLLS
jgi:superfamily II DNA or RNA helicase